MCWIALAGSEPFNRDAVIPCRLQDLAACHGIAQSLRVQQAWQDGIIDGTIPVGNACELRFERLQRSVGGQQRAALTQQQPVHLLKPPGELLPQRLLRRDGQQR